MNTGWKTIVRGAAILVVSLAAALPAAARDVPADPLKSVMWADMAERFLAGGDIVFDQRVRVMAPRSAEDQFFVPVTVDATRLPGVTEIVVLADLNPIPKVLAYRPVDAEAFIAFQIKVEQATVVRAAARTADGIWHVGGTHVDAAGGGCSSPAMAHGQANWMATLGQTRARVWRETRDVARMTVRMRHPMDTGLADGIPAFYLSDLEVSNGTGRPLASIDIYEPVSENPTFTLKPRIGADTAELDVEARDTEANEFAYSLPVPDPKVAN
ncbi:quinoprotein dehydrogenase-associated SoxYZ-like carrier [Zhengella mangrovi]|uniref:Quinoprotein dehydrogenase-associated SoxYZ-like carrier n=1 Tax=Zhengella mangrovi TaxID=1982044 RepID=A0A2G1QMR2_9HYPH|nr:quinoprotein dehydrogenase-associated SoxYZ-like carrier [Zhengella mangrovi]PHP66751.1 quinoprotein dehydrogenase-associated SoxYZ-like carrier [Zhengella mangrovi]